MAGLQTCPKCRALLEPGTKTCPYCEADQSMVRAKTPEQDARATGGLGMWLIGACVVLYLLMVVLDPARGDKEESSLEPTWTGIITFGAHHPFYVRHCGQWWRLVTANFVHLGPIHLLMNCIALFYVIPLAGMTFGVRRSWVIFLLTGVLSVVASDLYGQSGGGASGALCGMIGALGVYGKRRGGFEGRMLSRRMFGWAIAIVAFGIIMPRVDNVAHGAGFAAGAAIGWFGAAVRARGGRADRVWESAAHTCTAIVVAVAALFLLPNVLRGQERRELILFNDSVQRALKAADGGGGRIPTAIGEGPADSDELRAAVNRLLASVHAGAPREQRHSEKLNALDRWGAWQARVRCSHQIRTWE